MSHIVALEREILPHSLVRSRLKGVDLVIWRGKSGEIHVWEDRCPHRSIRLSAGRNMGSYLEGVYHGWRFGEAGSVVLVPAEGKAYPEISVRKLKSVVTSGFVWASEGDVSPDDLGLGTPFKPMHFNVSAQDVSTHLRAQERATPWGSSGCMVYGLGVDSTAELHRLSALRRRLEVAS